MEHNLEVMVEDLGFWGELIIAFVFAIIAERFLKLLKLAMHPDVLIVRVKEIDVTNPLVLFTVQVMAVLTGLALANALGLL